MCLRLPQKLVGLCPVWHPVAAAVISRGEGDPTSSTSRSRGAGRFAFGVGLPATLHKVDTVNDHGDNVHAYL